MSHVNTSQRYTQNVSRLDHERASLSGLPRQFVNSMKTLFNILDDAGVGYVPLTEIERRWRDDAVPNLPGVLDSLRAVAPKNGLLSFDVFVWGLRSALAKARKCRDNNQDKRFETNDVKSCIYTNQMEADYTNRMKENVKPQASKTNDVIQKRLQCLKMNVRGPRSSSYFAQPASDKCEYDKSPTVDQQSSTDTILQNENHCGGFKPNHRRSNSGPITTARYTLQIPPMPWDKEFSKSTKMGYATKFSARSLKGDFAETESDLTTASTAKRLFGKSELDRVTAKTLFVTTDKEDPLKPVALSGTFIGLTGTVQRTKSTSANQHDSLRRPKHTTSNIISSSETCFGLKNSSTLEKGLPKPGLEQAKADTDCFQQYASAVESGDEHFTGLDRNSWNERKRAASTIPRGNTDVANQDGEGRRCNSASPPERPVMKSAINSNSPDLDLNLSFDEEEIDREINLSTQKNLNHFTTLKELTKPPPPGRVVTARKAIFSNDTFANSSTYPTSSIGKNNIHYGTVGKRRNNKRREQRRHTVADGIDYNALKCIKQLEQEKDLIMQGIKALDIGHQWFQRRLCEVQERQRQVENVGIKSTAIETEFVLGLETEPGSASTRLDLFLTKVSQMNRLLKSIVDLSNVNGTKGSLAPERSPENSSVLDALREQNHLLTMEVACQTDRIDQLEREKSVLVQQLFQAKAEALSGEEKFNTSIFI
ncbi:unnamed protein product [Clavelina lepadiformis]|uniref:Suppressor APC domain-containing protein n=1 Tax=Clavelina lepadiformis TaxID=159417 RepID=A0ABP0F6A1_CLALP